MSALSMPNSQCVPCLTCGVAENVACKMPHGKSHAKRNRMFAQTYPFVVVRSTDTSLDSWVDPGAEYVATYDPWLYEIFGTMVLMYEANTLSHGASPVRTHHVQFVRECTDNEVYRAFREYRAIGALMWFTHKDGEHTVASEVWNMAATPQWTGGGRSKPAVS